MLNLGQPGKTCTFDEEGRVDKLNELGNAQKLIAGGGVLMLIASFLPWYKISFSFGEFGGGSVSANGWEAPGAIFSILAVLVGVAMAVAILGPIFANLQLPDLGNITWGQAHLGLGVAALVLVVLKFLNESDSLSYGFFIGLIAALALAAGGYLMYTEEKAKT